LTNAVFFKKQLRFEVIDLKAHAPRAVPRKKIQVIIGPSVAWAFEDRFDAPMGFGVLFGGFRALPGKRLAPLERVSPSWDS
jgi:hypothetical protein